MGILVDFGMDEKGTKEDWLGRLMGLSEPWSVERVSSPAGGRDGYVTVRVKHSGAGLSCPRCGGAAKRHDGHLRAWRDLDLHRRRTKVEAVVPRAKCDACGVVLTVPAPWADHGSRFTVLFEADAIALMKAASISEVAAFLGISWDQAAGIQARAVRRGKGRRAEQCPKRIGVDETSFRKGHRYLTVVNDLDSGAVLHVAERRDKEALAGFLRSLSSPVRLGLELVAMDMHAPYVQAVREQTFAAVAFDKFHVAQALSRGVDEVRRAEQKALGDDAAGLKRTRFLWLRHTAAMTAAARERLAELTRQFARLGRAWSIKEWAMSLWDGDDRKTVEAAWVQWIKRTQRSRLKPMVKVAGMVRRHLQGIVTAVCSGVTNARAESVNAKIQWIKRMAHGCRNMERFKDAILFHLGKLALRPATLVNP